MEVIFVQSAQGSASPKERPPKSLEGPSATAAILRWRTKQSSGTSPTNGQPPTGAHVHMGLLTGVLLSGNLLAEAFTRRQAVGPWVSCLLLLLSGAEYVSSGTE